jgi:hypothetical protein
MATCRHVPLARPVLAMPLPCRRQHATARSQHDHNVTTHDHAAYDHRRGRRYCRRATCRVDSLRTRSPPTACNRSTYVECEDCDCTRLSRRRRPGNRFAARRRRHGIAVYKTHVASHKRTPRGTRTHLDAMQVAASASSHQQRPPQRCCWRSTAAATWQTLSSRSAPPTRL